MRFEISVIDGMVALRPIGDQSEPSSVHEWDEIHSVLQRQTGWIILDFSDLSYLASSSLRDVLEIRKRAVNQSGGVVIVGMGKTVQDIFRITGILPLFDLVDDLESALAFCESKIHNQ